MSRPLGPVPVQPKNWATMPSFVPDLSLLHPSSNRTSISEIQERGIRAEYEARRSGEAIAGGRVFPLETSRSLGYWTIEVEDARSRSQSRS